MAPKTLRTMGFFFILILLTTGTNFETMNARALPPVSYSQGLNILIYGGNTFGAESESFSRTWRVVGNTVNYTLDFDFTSPDLYDYDVLLLPRPRNLNEANISAIAAWFETDEKLLWISGDTDFSGLYNINATANSLLTQIHTELRLFSGTINDPVSNDASSIRLLANRTGVTSPMTTYVTKDFDQMFFYSPTAVMYQDNVTKDYHDLRTANLNSMGSGNISILVNSSSTAVAEDEDGSNTELDLYAGLPFTGNYPMIVSDLINSSMVIVSGDSVFSDYKDMYGSVTEIEQEGHNSSVVVDRILTYYFTELNNYPSIDLLKTTETQTRRASTNTVNVTTTEVSVSILVSTVRDGSLPLWFGFLALLSLIPVRKYRKR